MLSNVIIILLFPFILTSFKKYSVLVFKYSAYMYGGTHVHLVLAEVSREHRLSWNWNSRQL